MNIISDFFYGIGLPFRALKFMFKQSKYWRYASVSIIINIILYIVMFYLLFHFVIPLVDSWFPAHSSNEFLVYLYKFIEFVIKFIIVATFIIMFVLVFNTLFFSIASPFLDILSLKIEDDFYNYIPAKAGIKAVVRGCYISVKNGIWLNFMTIFWAIVLFPLNFIIPIVGFLPGMLVASYFLGLSFIIYSAEHRRITKKEFKHEIKGSRMSILGLGLVMYWILFVPFTAILFIPASVVAGTMLYNEKCENREFKRIPKN